MTQKWLIIVRKRRKFESQGCMENACWYFGPCTCQAHFRSCIASTTTRPLRPMGLLLKFWDYDFSQFFFDFINMGPYGSQNFKMLLLPQILSNFFWIFFSVVLTKVWFEFLKLWVFDFSRFYFAITWDPMAAKTSKRYSSHKSLLDFSKVFLNFPNELYPKDKLKGTCI